MARVRNRFVLDADAVRERLKQLSLTQGDLAQAVSVDLRSVQRWLAGRAMDEDDAVAVARRLGVGMRVAFQEIPPSYGVPLLDYVRPALAWLEGREQHTTGLLSLVTSAWSPLVSLLETHGQPLDGYVYRADVTRAQHVFARMRLALTSPGQRVEYAAQCGAHVRYRCGAVWVEQQDVRLVEYAFTRAMRARRPDGEPVELWVWIPREMTEVVLVSDAPFDVLDFDARDRERTLFHRERLRSTGAVAFRPPPTDLLRAKLPVWDDRTRPNEAFPELE